ncbi:MAG: glycosyltransferase [Clostridia bacterium]|nr:glycosyltransferase [Clostridia bacterium]
MENNDLISIVVPIYNVEEYLKRCVDTIINQTYKNLEIILVDDGAKDNSGKICDEYINKDNRIKVIHKENGGLSDARNVGLENANGEYIAFIDSDDYISKDFIEKLYNLCIEKNAEIAQCSYQRVYDNKNSEENNTEIKTVTMDGNEAILKLFASKNSEYTVAWNKLYKTSLFDTGIRYPKGMLHEDEATTYKLFYKAKNIVVTNEELYYYYIRKNSITNKKYTLQRLDFIKELEEQLEFFKTRNEENLYKETYYRYARGLIQAYFKCKQNIENSENVQAELMKKYKNASKELLKIKEISLKRKAILILGLYFPSLYEKIIEKRDYKVEK